MAKVNNGKGTAPAGNSKEAANKAKDAAKEAAEALKKEKAEAAEKKAKEAEDKKAAKEAEKAEKAAARAEESAKRKAIKGGPGKLLRSFAARIKYMRYMDNPSSTLENVELLSWVLTLTNSEGTTYIAERGDSVSEVKLTTKENGKKAVVEVHQNDDESLEAMIETLKP